MKPVEYQNILAVDHLEKGYNYISSKGEEVSCPVLENISFQIEPKEFVGIMGRSGCGKTTLLKVLGMLDKPEKGTVFYKGKDTKEIYGTELAKIRRTELSFIFQDFCLMDSLSIKDNILLPRILDEAEIEESKKICENLTKKFNINKLLNKKPYELSGGEKQRVAICRALIISSNYFSRRTYWKFGFKFFRSCNAYFGKHKWRNGKNNSFGNSRSYDC